MANPAEKNFGCVQCEASFERKDPFCTKCGKLSPRIMRQGALAVRLDEIPSEKLRNQLLDRLKNWFPDLDRLLAEDRLKKGSSILVRGVDEDSANRILNELKPLQIHGNLQADKEESWFERFLGPGFAASAILLASALLVRGRIGFILLIVAVGILLVNLVRRENRKTPLITIPSSSWEADNWIELSESYSHAIAKLEPTDSDALSRLVTKIFDLQNRLKSGSVVSIAAGAEKGGLYKRLLDAIATGIDISNKLAGSNGVTKTRLRDELASLNSLVEQLSDWYLKLESGEPKGVFQLEESIKDITQSIDRIMEDVRPLNSLKPNERVEIL